MPVNRKTFFISVFLFLLVGGFPDGKASSSENEKTGHWKAGVAQVKITPEQSMWMAGYAAREHPSEGKIHDLWAKALVLQDTEGNTGVLITTDLLGFPKDLSDNIRNRLNEKYNLSRAQIILNSSHTHSGPVLEGSLYDIYPLNSSQLEKIERYSDYLTDKIVELVGKAINSLQPAQVYAENGVTRFQVNRRNNEASTLARQRDLNGPNDYSVPVIKVEDAGGDMMAVAFGYACHPTVLDGYQWSGDYPGFAQKVLEEDHQGTVALFFQGAGADQNPLPRRSEALALQYGRELAAAVDRVLEEDMRRLSSSLSMAYSEVELSLNDPPSARDLEQMTEETSGYQKRWAERMLGKVRRGESFRSSYPYPFQVWQLGDQPLVSLGGEVVVDYAIRLKRIFGQELFVLGYSNDVMAYIPTVQILREGGYEGLTSQIVYGLPGAWEADIETKIIKGVLELAARAGISLPEEELTGQ